jgi:hypothetical protein
VTCLTACLASDNHRIFLAINFEDCKAHAEELSGQWVQFWLVAVPAERSRAAVAAATPAAQ